MAYTNGEKVYVDGQKHIAHDGKLYTPDQIYANNDLLNKYGNLISNKEITTYQPHEEKKKETGKVAKPYIKGQYQDAQALAKANLDVLTPTTPLDNPIAQILLQSGEFKDQMKNLGANAANPVGMSDEISAANILKQSMGASDTEKALQQKLMDFMTQGGQQKYADNEYNRIANQLNYAAQLQKEKDAADLASRGLGMSTIVSDVNSVTNRDLLHELQKTGYDAEKLGQDFMTDLFSKGTTLENNIGTRTGTNATKLSEIGGKKADIYGNAQNAYNNAIAYQDANTAANLSLQNQGWKDKVNNFKWFAELPFAVNNSGNTAASLANSTANNVYNSQVQGSANDNTNWMNLLGTGLSSFMTKGLK